MSKLVDSLLVKYPLVSDQVERDELRVILVELEKVIDNQVGGDVVEFGCYTGTTSLFLQRLLREKQSDKQLWVYDSFDGLPEKTKEDDSPLGVDFKRGELRSTKAEFVHNFRKAQLPLPRITKKWFHEVEDKELPDTVCFAFLDGDYYKSIRASLSLVLPRIQQGCLILVDDFDNPALPGAARACRDANVQIARVVHSLGICTLD
jgi:O-methyltransferase